VNRRRDERVAEIVDGHPGISYVGLRVSTDLSTWQLNGALRRLKRRKRVMEIDSRNLTDGSDAVERRFFPLNGG
jgi:hypothetical protein